MFPSIYQKILFSLKKKKTKLPVNICFIGKKFTVTCENNVINCKKKKKRELLNTNDEDFLLTTFS